MVNRNSIVRHIRNINHRLPIRFTMPWSLLPLTLVHFVTCPFFYIAAVLGSIYGENIWIQLFFFVILLSLIFYANVNFRELINDNVDRIRNAIYSQQSAATSDKPFILFLRSFRHSAGYYDEVVSFSILNLMEPALCESGFRPCTLGTTLPLSPQNRVVMINCDDDVWWRNYEALSSAAAVIFIFPEISGSLLREIKYLRESSFLGKTLLVMPPFSLSVVNDIEGSGGTSQGGIDYAKEQRWLFTRDTWCEAFNVSLPDYSSSGALIELDGNGYVVKSTTLRTGDVGDDFWTLSERTDNLDRYGDQYKVPFKELWGTILSRRQFTGAPLKAIWPTLKQSSIQPCLLHYWRPPGDNGRLRSEVRKTLVLNWSILLLMGLTLWASSVFNR